MKKSTILLLVVLAFLQANAQKLPNVQQTSLRAPTNVKIDGKAEEWGNKFQAKNNATDISYSIANDNDKLYLVIQANDEYIIKKMLLGRTVFTINKSDKKIDDNVISISYPVVSRKERPVISFKIEREEVSGKVRSDVEGHSLMKANNKQLTAKHKFIKVKGLPNVDTLLAVYNTSGIEATSAFDNKLVYTYELAIDLKLLGLNVTNPKKFYYNVMLDKLEAEDIPGVKVTRDDNDNIIGFDISKATSFSPSYSLVTDFWGEYTLVKK